MRSLRPHLLLLFVLAVLAIPASWGQRYSFRQYGRAEGLQNLSVVTLAQDADGFIWVGTANGLYRWDGHRMTPFGAAEGLPGQLVLKLFAAPDGMLWAHTLGGMARFNGARFEKIEAGASLMPGPGIISAGSDGRVWLATERGVAVSTSPVKRGEAPKFVIRPAEPGRFEPVVSVAVTEGHAWVGCGRRICRMEDGSTKVYGPAEGVEPDAWGKILIDRSGRVWARSQRRLVVLHPGAVVFERANDGLPDGGTFADMVMDRTGVHLWVPTSSGLAGWMGEFKPSAMWRLFNKRDGLPIDDIQTILQDREGSYWMGTFGAGVVRWLGQGRWQAWDESHGLPSEQMRAIYRDGSGVLWVGTNRGVARFEEAGQRWTPFPLPSSVSIQVDSILSGPDGSVWFGSSRGGLVRKAKDGSITPAGVEQGLRDARVSSLVFDRDGRLWVAAWNSLQTIDQPSGRIQYQPVTIPGAQAMEFYSDLMRDRSGNVWVAGTIGLARWDGKSWMRIPPEAGFRSRSLSRVVEGADGSLYVGYRDAAGLTRVKLGASPEFTHYSSPKQLRSDKSLSLGVDSAGRIWHGSDNGVDVFDPKSGTWRHFGASDGLAWEDCNQDSFWADDLGIVWIGTSRGLARFRPPPQWTVPPPLEPRIVSMRFGGQPIANAGDPEIPYNRRTLDAQFAVPSYLSEGSVRFATRLRDVETDWNESASPEIRYPALGPGRYVLEVKAAHSANVWSEPVRYAFTIATPWWRSWWFFLACGGVLAAFGSVIWQWRMNTLIEEQRRLERAVEMRTAEIHRLLDESERQTELKSKFLATMSHEIRTPMNGIVGLTELAIDAEQPAERSEYLRLVRSSVHSLLEILNQILDFSKIEAGRVDLESKEFPPRPFFEDLFATYEIRVREKGLGFAGSLDRTAPAAVAGDPTRIRQVLTNLVENAIKFTAKGSISVDVRVEETDGETVLLRCSVRDTGIGIPAEKMDVIFDSFRQADETTTRQFGGTGLGLTISRELVNLMGGRMWVESRVGEGSTFLFTIRLRVVHPSDPRKPHRQEPAAAPVALRILVAEDNAVNQRVLQALLEKQGHSVALAGDGVEAVAAIEREEFDLVLMDVQMPRLGGLEATARVRASEKGRRTRIVAMTANVLEGDRERCIESGMDSYLAKPVRPADLIELAEAVARERANAG